MSDNFLAVREGRGGDWMGRMKAAVGWEPWWGSQGSTGTHRCRQPSCHLLEEMPGCRAVVILRSREVEAGFPEATCLSCSMGVSGALSALILYPGSTWVTPLTCVVSPAFSARQGTLFPVYIPLPPPACGPHYRSLLSLYPFARLKKPIFFPYFFSLILSFWKKLGWLIHMNSICVIQAI